jgi:hypothetical protein
VEQLTPEETGALIKAGQKLLKEDAEERWAHTKIIATAAGAKLM